MTNDAFNSLLRRAARGRAVEPAPRDQVGSIGCGVGGGASGRQMRPAPNEQINAALRTSMLAATGRVPIDVRYREAFDR